MQFLRFCSIGGLGFLVDSLTFLILLTIRLDPLFARLLSFWLAAFFTWLGNRLFTFKTDNSSNWHIQLIKHMATAHIAGSLNLFIFWLMSEHTPMYVAFLFGISSGLLLNYSLSKLLVFKVKAP